VFLAAGLSSMGKADLRPAFAPGTLVGERYRIVSPLARGGFGVVYVAEQLATTRQVALKLMTAHLYAISVDQLLAEARIASRVNSEHIVQVYDAGIDPETSLVFVAMELLSGTNLAELVKNRGPVSAGETAEYLRQVAVGLDKVHGVLASDGRPAPIVHRDLKPANLFLTRREDGSAWLKILDFGAAKLLSDEGQVSSILRGTPEYMAYEQASGGAITPATDIWAFGLVAFYLLTGRPYWRGAQNDSGRSQIFGEVLTLPLVPASERARELGAPALPPAFDDWFARCVNRDPSERHASAGDAARALVGALGVNLGPVPAPSLPSPPAGSTDAPSSKASSLITQDLTGAAASSRSRRTARSVPILLVVLLALNAAGALFLWARTRAPEATPSPLRDAGSTAAPPAPRPDPALDSAALARESASSVASGALPAPSASGATHRGPRVPVRAQRSVLLPSPSTTVPSSAAGPSPQSHDVYDLR
jgi:eukaryotic-like serine/threonine-protein kinase